MSTDIRTWRCGKCQLTVDIPPEYPTTPYIDALMWIREHRFAHLVSALEQATEEELLGMSGDEGSTNPWAQGDPHAIPVTPPASLDPVQTDDGDYHNVFRPVEAEDAGYVLAGITELLKADLPRARRRQNNV